MTTRVRRSLAAAFVLLTALTVLTVLAVSAVSPLDEDDWIVASPESRRSDQDLRRLRVLPRPRRARPPHLVFSGNDAFSVRQGGLR